MFGKEYALNNSLSKVQIKKMHGNALDLIETVGVKIPHDGILRILSDYDGVKIELPKWCPLKKEN